jgi:hypothetical protein
MASGRHGYFCFFVEVHEGLDRWLPELPCLFVFILATAIRRCICYSQPTFYF